MVLNGINYTEKRLTDEEMAVINAMRQGGDVEVIFQESTQEFYEEQAETMEYVLNHKDEIDCTEGEGRSFISYELKNAEYCASVVISYYVDK